MILLKDEVNSVLNKSCEILSFKLVRFSVCVKSNKILSDKTNFCTAKKIKITRVF